MCTYGEQVKWMRGACAAKRSLYSNTAMIWVCDTSVLISVLDALCCCRLLYVWRCQQRTASQSHQYGPCSIFRLNSTAKSGSCDTDAGHLQKPPIDTANEKTYSRPHRYTTKDRNLTSVQSIFLLGLPQHWGKSHFLSAASSVRFL